jgi:DNA-binding MarR family transcriptional regulator
VATSRQVESRRLTLGAAAASLRRAVGPVAWSVLEAVAERCEDAGDRTVSYRSVRDVAADLGVAKDTVAKALRRLRGAGLLEPESARQTSGWFGRGRYVITLPPNVFDLAADVAAADSPALVDVPSSMRSRPVSRVAGARRLPSDPSLQLQLALLPGD